MLDRFACPTMDSTFKLLFGEDSHKKITVAFLNDILCRQGDDKIEHIDFIKQEQTPRRFDERKMILDISCKTTAGHQFIIEMSSCAKASADKQNKIDQNIFIRQKNDELNNSLDQNFLSAGALAKEDMDKDTKEQSIDLIELVFLDLKKFNKQVDELENQRDKWLFFLKRAMDQRDIPQVYNDSPMIQEAFRVMERMNWSDNQMYQYEEELRAFKRDLTQKEADEEERKKNEEARKKLKKELEQAIQAKEKAIDIGLEKGKQEKAIETAINFLKLGFPVDKIAQGTGLTIEQIMQLQDKK